MSHSHSHSHADNPAPAPKKADDVVPILFVDAVAGVTAPMLLGALIDLGVDEKAVQGELEKLKSGSPRISSRRESSDGIEKVKADLFATEGKVPFSEVVAMIGAAPLADGAKAKTLKALFPLAKGEASAFAVALHEVAVAMSAVLEIASVCIALDQIGIEHIVSGPVTVGGALAPTTLAVLKDFPIRKIADVECETSAAGAALVASLAAPAIDPVVMTPRRIGYGAGSKDAVLRLVIADSAERFLPPSLFPCEECGDDHDDEGHGHGHSHDHGHSHKH
ncbi:hypothetical protein BH09SUM1_BH09SUM1_01760 [soil metagenome]